MSRLTRRLVRKLTFSRPAIHLYDCFQPARDLGQRGELAAERFLLKQGMVIVARRFQDKFGEIDLIAIDDDSIVFVEVKTRSSDLAGLPADAVNETKQEHLTRTAQGYMKWNRLTECQARFDVVAITWPSGQRDPAIEHFVSAFEPVGRFQMF